MSEIVKAEAHAPATIPTTLQADAVDLHKWAADLNAAKAIGNALAATAFVPAHFQGKPDDAAAAIMAGAGLGLTPSQALEMFYVVHGRAGMYARNMGAIAMRAGHQIEDVETTDTAVTVRAKRKGSKMWRSFTWTMDRAKQAGYTSNKKYQSNPIEMLRAKCWAEAVRTIAPDALAGMGVYSVEEIELEDLGERPAPPAAPTVSTEPDAAAITEAQWRDLLAAGAERGLSPAEVGNLAASTVGRPLTGWQAITTDDLDGITAAINAYSKEN